MLHRLLAVAFVITPLLAQTAPPKPAPLGAKAFLVDDIVTQNHIDQIGRAHV